MRRGLAVAGLVLAGGCSLFDASGERADQESCEADEPVRTTTATWDPTATGGGNCTFGPSDEVMVAGVSGVDYDGSVGCGGCIAVERPGRAIVVVRVVDSCTDCADGRLVLSDEAFAMLEPDLEVGVIDVSWRWVECPVDGAIGIHFIEDASPDWLAVQVRFHRHRIASMEARVSEAPSWRLLERTDYNYFIADDGLGEGPFDFRITDIYGHVIEEPEMELGMGVVRGGDTQFASCE